MTRRTRLRGMISPWLARSAVWWPAPSLNHRAQRGSPTTGARRRQANRPERAPSRIDSQVQLALEEAPAAVGIADIDDRRAVEILFEHGEDALTRLASQRVQRLVDDDPARLVQGKLRK